MEVFQFGGPGAHFGYTSNSPFWCYPNLKCATPMIFGMAHSVTRSRRERLWWTRTPFADGDQLLSSWSGDSTLSMIIATPPRFQSYFSQHIPRSKSPKSGQLPKHLLPLPQRRSQAHISAKQIPALSILMQLAGSQHNPAACILSFVQVSPSTIPV